MYAETKRYKCLSIVNNLPIKEQLNYLGDRIYPYIKKKVGNLAGKMTGMILDLPRSQLIPGVKNTHTLDRMIKEAQETLEEHHLNEKVSQDSLHENIQLANLDLQ